MAAIFSEYFKFIHKSIHNMQQEVNFHTILIRAFCFNWYSVLHFSRCRILYIWEKTNG